MQTATFDYYRPETVAEALDLLGIHSDARPLAGGHSLLPAMKLRVSSPAALIDLGRIPGLRGITRSGANLVIGATTTHAEVAASQAVQNDCPVLADTAAHIGDPQVRNRGTIGGSIAHADPAADYPTLLRALGATITATGKEGEREIAADDFFVDVFATALGQGELVTSVSVPAMAAGQAGVYLKHRHPASSYAVVGVAAVVKLDGGTCSNARIAVGGVTGKPERATAAEQALTGSEPTADAIGGAAARVSEALANPIGDVYASGEYRVHLAGVLAKRAISQAVAAAGG